MSEEALYALFLMALLLCAYYFTSGSQEPQSHQSSRKEQQISEDTLSVSASRLRDSLGIKRSKLQSNTVVSVSISLNDVSEELLQFIYWKSFLHCVIIMSFTL